MLSCVALFFVLAVGIVISFLAERRYARNVQREREFIALFSHELKTPLAVIRSTAQNLASGLYPSADDIRGRAETIVAANRRLSDLVESILATASGEIRSGEKIDLAALTATAVEKAIPFANAENAAIEFAAPRDTCTVAGDSRALSGAIDALLTNAVRYGKPKDGPHKIKVQVFRNDIPGLPPFRKARSSAYLVVADRGPGVPRQDIRRAKAGRIGKTAVGGGPATSGSESSGSSGLGLPLAIKTIKAHGGRVHFERWPGACVIAILPMEKA